MSKRGWLFSGLLHVGVIVAVVLGLPEMFESDALAPSDQPIVVSLVEIADESSTPPVEPEPLPEPVAEPEPEPEPVAAPEARAGTRARARAEGRRCAGPDAGTRARAGAGARSVARACRRTGAGAVARARGGAGARTSAQGARGEARPPAGARSRRHRRQIPLAKPKKKPSFDTLLQSLADEEPEAPPPPPKAKKEEPSFDDMLASIAGVDDEPPADAAAPAPLSGPLRRTITDAIKQKVERNWSVPAGVLDAGETAW